MKTVNKIVTQALAWKGKKESDGSHKEIIDIYNTQKPLPRGYKVKYTDAWCATFISALAVKLGYTDIIPTECSCEKMIALCKEKGVWVENENRVPNVGDIVFYDWQDNGKGDNKGYSDHVGLVVDASKTDFIAIEGNYSNSVKERTLNVNGKYIRGFAIPNYDKELSKPSETSSEVPNCITELAKLVIKGKYGTGHDNRMKNIYEQVRSEVNRLL